ncbi:MAG: hypothetical protein ACI9VS_000012 [Candidatus Binatia bacterium]|jgi:hypothetical protein
MIHRLRILFTRLGLLFVLVVAPNCPAAELPYYLPAGVEYDPAIPTPKSSLGWDVGEWHVRHDQMVAYMKLLAEKSGRIQIEVIGHTYEQRELLLLTVSSPANLKNIDAIRAEHLKLSQPGSNPKPVAEQPLVLYMGYNVHGDESSAGNSALLVAYHLAAAQGPEIDKLLANAVVLLDPCLNPDGLNRFAQWANSHRGKHPVGDTNHREHNAVWPAGRGNHYWFDLNRDWLLLQHPESRARIKKFHQWRPNVQTDFHEMGGHSTYFFQPGVPERKNPLTPIQNVRLTELIAGYHARALDAIGSLYYTEERFDDYYYGKGSTYPDIHGAVGILFEQASSRGHLRESPNGEFDFSFTIRNQFRTSLSTFKGALENRVRLLNYQKEFYEEALEAGKKDEIDGFVFGDFRDRTRTWHLLDVLLRHKIEVRKLTRTIEIDGRNFPPRYAYYVPMGQPQYWLARTIFEHQTDFPDNIFYDVSAWTFPLAMGVPYAPLKSAPRGSLGDAITAAPFPSAAPTTAEDAYAYAFEWTGLFAPRALHRLLKADVKARVAAKPLKTRTPSGAVELAQGSILVPMGIQDTDRAEILKLLKTIANEDGVKVHAISTGLTPVGVDLGSPSLKPLTKPEPLLIIGGGVSAYEAGEVWHLLDQRTDMKVTLLDGANFSGTAIDRYTHIILVNGAGSKITSGGVGKIGRWIDKGGVLIATKNSTLWAADKKLAKATFKKKGDDDGAGTTGKSKGKGEDEDEEEEKGKEDKEESGRLNYGSHDKIEDAKMLSGAIFKTDLDITHPLGYGYAERELAVFRNSRICMLPSKNPYGTVAQYTDEPLLSGYVHDDELEKLKGTASIIAEKRGKGAVILMVDNPNFRAYTHGTTQLFLNAIFFGPILEKTKE